MIAVSGAIVDLARVPGGETVCCRVIGGAIVDLARVPGGETVWCLLLGAGGLFDHDIPPVEAVFASIGEDGARLERIVAWIPTERITRATAVDADDFMVGLDHPSKTTTTETQVVAVEVMSNAV